MAFGQISKKPKAPTFYLKPAADGRFSGKVGEDDVLYKITSTGKHILELGGGKENGGSDVFGKPKTNQYGDFVLFVIDGHFWYGKTMTTKFGETFQLKQGAKAEDSDEWKAKQATKGVPNGDASEGGVGGAGPAGLSAPAGQPAGVQIRTGSASATEQFQAPVSAPKPPKPSNYKRSQG